MKPLRIIFAGTPAFGIHCLEAISTSGHDLVAVYTQPDRPAGRGRHLQVSAVKEWASNHQIPIYQPVHFKDAQTTEELKTLRPVSALFLDSKITSTLMRLLLSVLIANNFLTNSNATPSFKGLSSKLI